MLLSALRAWYAADPTDFRHVQGPIRVQSCGRAVGWVRNASLIRDDPAFYIAGFVLGVVRSIAELLERPTRILLLHPAVEASDFVAYTTLMSYIVS